jgi:hypothetical protein
MRPIRNTRAQTSVDILRERDALQARLREVDAALAGIEAEAQRALHHHANSKSPSNARHESNVDHSVLALARVASLVRQARGV